MKAPFDQARSRILVGLTVVLAIAGLTSCEARVTRTYGGGTQYTRGLRDDYFRVRDVASQRRNGRTYTQIRITSHTKIRERPKHKPGLDGVPLKVRMTNYVNSGGQHGTRTLRRAECWDGRSECLAGYSTRFQLPGAAEIDWCRYNGSMYFASYLAGWGWEGHRYWYCNGTQWVGHLSV